MAKPSLSTPVDVGLTVLRGLCVLVGGTLIAHRMTWEAAGDATAGGGANPIPGYQDWLGDAVSPSDPVIEALGVTLVVAAGGLLIGLLLAGAIALLGRARPPGSVLGGALGPYLAALVPGLAVFPLSWWLIERGTVASGPVSFGGSFSTGAASLALWAGVAGLAITPGLVASVTVGDRELSAAASLTRWSLASRPESALRWSVGLPATTLLLAVASVELLADQRGVFGLFAASVRDADLVTALDLTFLVIVSGALVAIVVDLIGLAVEAGPPAGPFTGRTTRAGSSGGLLALSLVAAVIAAVAVAGYSLDSAVRDTAGQLEGPTVGGPWLGTTADGQSVVGLAAAAFGPTVVAGLLPAVLAVALGAVVAEARRRASPFVDGAIGAIVDLAWWPLPFVVPLAILATQSPDRPELHLPTVAVLTVGLVPMASRLLGPRTPFSIGGGWWSVAAAGFMAAVATSIHLVIGFAGLNGDIPSWHGGLGRVMADGVDSYGESRWPVLVPLVTAVLLLAVLYRVAVTAAARATLTTEQTRPVSQLQVEPADLTFDRTLVLGEPEPEPVPGPEPDQATGSGLQPTADQPARVLSGPPDAMPDIDLTGEDVSVAAAPLGLTGETASATGDPDPAVALDPVGQHEDQPDTARQDHQATATAADHMPQDHTPQDHTPQDPDDEARAPDHDVDDDDDDDEPMMAAEASKTIELRPAALRRAGVTVKPVLARRPPPPASAGERTPSDDG